MNPEVNIKMLKGEYPSHIQDELAFALEPSYVFNVGDHVTIGNLKDPVVVEVLEGGKLYLISYVSQSKDTMNKVLERYALWHQIRPIVREPKPSLIRNKDIKFTFYNNTIESLLSKVLSAGVDFNPDYQRDLVWTAEQKEDLIDSIFGNIDIGKFCFIVLGDAPYYEILDGKQRLSAILDFYLNKFPYKGIYYNELNGKDKIWFRDFPVSVAETSEKNRKQVLRYFLMLNTSGKPMDKEHLDKIKEMYEETE